MARARLTSARLEADLYALTHRGNAGDAAFYERTCAGASSVLELGSGDGRLLSKLTLPGRRVVGLERDPEMLAAARRNLRRLPSDRRRSVQLLRADMRNFELQASVECVFLPYNGLYCLLTQRDALRCFRAVRAALPAGGVFAFDVWNAEGFQPEETRPANVADAEPLVTLDHAGRTWDVFEHTRIGRARQRLDVVYHYVPHEAGVSHRIAIPQRYFLADELRDLLLRAGFEVHKRYGDFSAARFTSRAPHLIVIARAV
jgi:SAM-dependent methyltransferase